MFLHAWPTNHTCTLLELITSHSLSDFGGRWGIAYQLASEDRNVVAIRYVHNTTREICDVDDADNSIVGLMGWWVVDNLWGDNTVTNTAFGGMQNTNNENEIVWWRATTTKVNQQWWLGDRDGGAAAAEVRTIWSKVVLLMWNVKRWEGG